MVLFIESCRDEVMRRIAAEEVIAVPGPDPFPYVLCASSSEAVNDAKGRQSSQSVIVMLESVDRIRRYVALPDRAFRVACALASGDHVHLLLPHTTDLPDVYKGACREGYLGVSTAWHPQLAFLLEADAPVFASSANASGSEPISSAAEVDKLLGGKHLVVLDPSADGGAKHSGAIVRVQTDGALDLVRSGYQVVASGLSPEQYIDGLRVRLAKL